VSWEREAYKSKRRRQERAEEARRGLCDGAEVSKLADGGGRGKEKVEALRPCGLAAMGPACRCIKLMR